VQGAKSAAVPTPIDVRSEFRDLVAHQRALALSMELHRAVAAWPSFGKWSIGMQLVRAMDSVGSNIAESSGCRHPKERRQFLGYAWRSLHEVENWLVLAAELKLVAPDATDALDEVARTLNGLIKRTGR
jgi:four helix bundle protein